VDEHVNPDAIVRVLTDLVHGVSDRGPHWDPEESRLRNQQEGEIRQVLWEGDSQAPYPDRVSRKAVARHYRNGRWYMAHEGDSYNVRFALRQLTGEADDAKVYEVLRAALEVPMLPVEPITRPRSGYRF
jgi:hypothetical protein